MVEDLKYIFGSLLFVGSIILFGYSSVFRWIVGIGLLLIVAFFLYVLFEDFDGTKELKWKFGDGYEEAIRQGKLSLWKAYPCVPNGYYTSKSRIEELSEVTFPDFIVKECQETLVDFTGDYSGMAEIEFEKSIDDEIIREVTDNMRISGSKWHRDGSYRYSCDLKKPNLDYSRDDEFWRISIIKGDSKGYITYGRI